MHFFLIQGTEKTSYEFTEPFGKCKANISVWVINFTYQSLLWVRNATHLQSSEPLQNNEMSADCIAYDPSIKSQSVTGLTIAKLHFRTSFL